MADFLFQIILILRTQLILRNASELRGRISDARLCPAGSGQVLSSCPPENRHNWGDLVPLSLSASWLGLLWPTSAWLSPSITGHDPVIPNTYWYSHDNTDWEWKQQESHFKNKHCEVLVSCSGRKLDHLMKAQRTACRLMELQTN